MYAYARYCPVAAATQVVGDFWTPLIVRELLYGTDHFNQLVRNLPGISRTLLANKLRALERAGVLECQRAVAPNSTRYSVTQAGRDLQPVIDAMNEWGSRWGEADTDPSDLDPLTMICMLKSRIHTATLPDDRIVIEVAVVATTESRAWLVCERHAVSICFGHPGFDVDLWLSADAPTLHSIWLQRMSVSTALKGGRMAVQGRGDLVKAFAGWFDGEITNKVA